MPQNKKESLFDKFRRAERFAKDKPSSAKNLQGFTRSESERLKNKKPKEMKDSRWFKHIKPDINLPLNGSKYAKKK